MSLYQKVINPGNLKQSDSYEFGFPDEVQEVLKTWDILQLADPPYYLVAIQLYYPTLGSQISSSCSSSLPRPKVFSPPLHPYFFKSTMNSTDTSTPSSSKSFF